MTATYESTTAKASGRRQGRSRDRPSSTVPSRSPSRCGLLVVPGLEPALNRRLADQAFVEPDLEQERQRLSDERSRRDAELLHHLLAVELGPDRGQLLLRGQRGDARLELVHPPAQHRRLALVAGRAVARASARSARPGASPASRTYRRTAESDHPRRYVWNRRCSATSSVIASMSSFEYRSSVSRLRVMRAPTASWWWNVVPLPGWKPRVRGLPMSWNSAARRVRRKSNGRTAVGRPVGCSSRTAVGRCRPRRWCA